MSERKKLELLLDIRKTFKTQLENHEIFVETAPQYFDTEQAVDDLFFMNWYHVPLQVLIKHRIHFWALTSDAFHFYFPAMLTAIIKHPHEVDTLMDNVLYALTMPESDSTTYPFFVDRVSKFSKEESRVIARFLDDYFELFPLDKWGHSNKDIKEILTAHQFWLSKIEEDI